MNNVGALEIKGTEGELMSQELADIKVDSFAGDDEDDEGIPELENVVDLIFDALKKRRTGVYSYQMHVPFCSIRILNAFFSGCQQNHDVGTLWFFVSDKKTLQEMMLTINRFPTWTVLYM